MDHIDISQTTDFASKSQVAFAEFQYYKYLANEDMQEGLTVDTVIDDSMLRQHDGKLGYLKS